MGRQVRHGLTVKVLVAATLAAAALPFLASVTDAAGHRTRIDEATGRTRLFTYDDLNRLAAEQVTGERKSIRMEPRALAVD